MIKKSKIFVGMSGGVDSSVAALLLKQQGHEVVGLFMKNWEDDEHCPAEQDYNDVAEVCEKIGIPYYTVNFAKEYWDNVFSDFLTDIKKGFTPNPDILCNSEIKFKIFYEKARSLGAEYLATGHYCQTDGKGHLLKGVDSGKDQSYFLHAVESEVLKNVLFPIGNIEKSKVREIALEHNLITHNKKDSTGICFIGERKFREFLANYVNKSKGQIQMLDGEVVGEHEGLPFYTLGQRKGLGLGGPGEPWFVVGKKLRENIIEVARGKAHPALYADGLSLSKIHWIGDAPTLPHKCRAKIRYRQSDQDCTLSFENENYIVKFDVPQRAATTGQSIVFYDENRCLGGGVIEAVEQSYFHRGATLPEIFVP